MITMELILRLVQLQEQDNLNVYAMTEQDLVPMVPVADQAVHLLHLTFAPMVLVQFLQVIVQQIIARLQHQFNAMTVHVQ